MNGTRILGAVLAVVLSMVGGARGAIAQDTSAAEKAVATWLELVDAGKYADSWSSAAASFKQAVTPEQWDAAATKARGSVGTLKSRTKAKVTPATNPPGAPPGDYVSVEFSAAFEHQPAATENVIVVREPDDTWRVVGYFVR